MKQVKIACPRCKENFQVAKADLYECPHCGTNIRPKAPKNDAQDLDKTQTLNI